MEKLEDLYNQPKSHIMSHVIEQSLSEYALQDLEEIFKPSKVRIEPDLLDKNSLRSYFLDYDAEILKNKFIEYCDQFKELNIPDNWKKPIINLVNRKKFMKYELEEISDDYKRIKRMFSANRNVINIKKIEVIQNIDIWEQFQTEIKLIESMKEYDEVISE
jgi:hypothetical protein